MKNLKKFETKKIETKSLIKITGGGVFLGAWADLETENMKPAKLPIIANPSVNFENKLTFQVGQAYCG